MRSETPRVAILPQAPLGTPDTNRVLRERGQLTVPPRFLRSCLFSGRIMMLRRRAEA
jgi:hypothetical protein